MKTRSALTYKRCLASKKKKSKKKVFIMIALQHVESGLFLHGAIVQRDIFSPFDDASVSCRQTGPDSTDGFVLQYQWGILSFPLLSAQTNVVRVKTNYFVLFNGVYLCAARPNHRLRQTGTGRRSSPVRPINVSPLKFWFSCVDTKLWFCRLVVAAADVVALLCFALLPPPTYSDTFGSHGCWAAASVMPAPLAEAMFRWHHGGATVGRDGTWLRLAPVTRIAWCCALAVHHSCWQ
jgi:hypothetical protein